MHLSDLLFGEVVVFVGGLAAHDLALMARLGGLGLGSDWQRVEAEVGQSAAQHVLTLVVWGILVLSHDHAS